MLELRNITKDYVSGNNITHALKGISVNFRKNEFVSILGQSGCGKTTTLNIIGGLDRYTKGNLLINGKSTKQYKDRDWDTYRNHSIGFVFQTYNLIDHQNILKNVELALTISGVSREERKQRFYNVPIVVAYVDALKRYIGEEYTVTIILTSDYEPFIDYVSFEDTTEDVLGIEKKDLTDIEKLTEFFYKIIFDDEMQIVDSYNDG